MSSEGDIGSVGDIEIPPSRRITMPILAIYTDPTFPTIAPISLPIEPFKQRVGLLPHGITEHERPYVDLLGNLVGGVKQDPKLTIRDHTETPANSDETLRAMYKEYLISLRCIIISAQAGLKSSTRFPVEVINSILYFLCVKEFKIDSGRAAATSSQLQLALMPSLDVAEQEYPADPQG